MTVAQSRLAELAAWFASNSAPRNTPLGGETSIGPWAMLIASDFADPPMPGFHAEALPLYVPAGQAAGLALPPIVTTAPDSQPRAVDRLHALIWRVRDGQLPPACIVGIMDAGAALSDAVDAAGASGIDLDAYPLIAAPVWGFTAEDRAMLRLPMIPLP